MQGPAASAFPLNQMGNLESWPWQKKTVKLVDNNYPDLLKPFSLPLSLSIVMIINSNGKINFP